jgi:hypothetical protein
MRIVSHAGIKGSWMGMKQSKIDKLSAPKTIRTCWLKETESDGQLIYQNRLLGLLPVWKLATFCHWKSQQKRELLPAMWDVWGRKLTSICMSKAKNRIRNKQLLHFHFLFPSLCGLSTFKTLYSVLNTCHFLKSSKLLHFSAWIGHPQVLKIL